MEERSSDAGQHPTEDLDFVPNVVSGQNRRVIVCRQDPVMPSPVAYVFVELSAKNSQPLSHLCFK